MTDRPVLLTEEIEITPEMIEAGVSAFLDHDSRFVSEADTVLEIFEAMLAAMGGNVLSRAEAP